MSTSISSQHQLLQRYIRPILAMRNAHHGRRFGLVLGAGVSKAFTFPVPDWKQLLERMASHPRVEGLSVDYPASTFASRSDLLYRHFVARIRSEMENAPKPDVAELFADKQDPHVIERIAKGEWRAIIREILYEHAPPAEGLREKHPYLAEYLEIVMKAPLTITFNFDSYLEMMLAREPGATERRGRAYETVFDGSVPFRSQDGVIYHPNGYLPLNVLERASDQLVFSEEEFGDQLLDSIAGRYSSLAHYLSKNICLLLGLSLRDENLRHFLRTNAVNNPGHFHYIVEWMRSDEDISLERRHALFEYRFTVYNLITLFLTDSDIAALGWLINIPTHEFRKIADQAGVSTRYIYYLTGVPGIGKTTVLRHLASLRTYDEWPSDPLPLLAKPYGDLSKEERLDLDDWVAKQFRTKNEALLAEEEGIFVVERAPLDPISFVSEEQIPEKAAWYRPRIVPTSYDQICSGRVLLLWGDTSTVASRIASRQTIKQSPKYLRELQEKLQGKIYTDSRVNQMFSTGWSIPELVRNVSKAIHLGQGEDVNLQTLLQKLEGQ